MKIIRIPIVESKQSTQAKLFNRLPFQAKKLFVMIARLSQSDNDSVSLDDIRNLNIFGSTPEIEQLLYTLESRGFGEVKVIGAEINFVGNRILMQSVL
jgi:hypothetical protein